MNIIDRCTKEGAKLHIPLRVFEELINKNAIKPESHAHLAMFYIMDHLTKVKRNH
jgi:hypothetical protein